MKNPGIKWVNTQVTVCAVQITLHMYIHTSFFMVHNEPNYRKGSAAELLKFGRTDYL